MLGWNIGVYTMVARNTSDATTPQVQPSMRDRTLAQGGSLRDRFAQGDRIAVWQSGIAGLRWIDELVKSGTAIAESTNGYPSVFYAKAVDVVPLLNAPPDARQVWASGPDDILTEKWAGRTVVDHEAAAACAPDEWLLIEAWDES
jgi:hypothetical protein